MERDSGAWVHPLQILNRPLRVPTTGDSPTSRTARALEPADRHRRSRGRWLRPAHARRRSRGGRRGAATVGAAGFLRPVEPEAPGRASDTRGRNDRRPPGAQRHHRGERSCAGQQRLRVEAVGRGHLARAPQGRLRRPRRDDARAVVNFVRHGLRLGDQPDRAGKHSPIGGDGRGALTLEAIDRFDGCRIRRQRARRAHPHRVG
jgi:hypothetical protein